MSDLINAFSNNLDRWAGAAGNWVERHWPWLFVFAVGLGLLLAVLAPILMALGAEWAARPIYWLYSHICHQRPERTL
jgi:MFS family permease